MAKERDKQRVIMEEIDFYKGQSEPEPEPQQNELAQLIPLIMLLKNAQQPEDLLGLIQSPQGQGPAKVQITPPINKVVSISDEALVQALNKIPKKQLKMARAFPDEIIKSYARKHFDFDEPTIERAITILREQ